MAFADDLTTIRNQLAAELKGETARRAALVAAGNPAPATYSVGGKNTDWNGYLSMMLDKINTLNEQVVAAGGDGGLYEEVLRGWS